MCFKLTLSLSAIFNPQDNFCQTKIDSVPPFYTFSLYKLKFDHQFSFFNFLYISSSRSIPVLIEQVLVVLITELCIYIWLKLWLFGALKTSFNHSMFNPYKQKLHIMCSRTYCDDIEIELELSLNIQLSFNDICKVRRIGRGPKYNQSYSDRLLLNNVNPKLLNLFSSRVEFIGYK